MYKYRSKCRWNMLLHVDGAVRELRPNEEFSCTTLLESRHVELLSPPKKSKAAKVVAKPGPKPKVKETLDGSGTG